MSVVVFPRRRPPAFGAAAPLGRRPAALRVLVLAALLAAALVVRATGVLHPAGTGLPALPGVAVVEPGIIRGGQPGDGDLADLRDGYGVRALVDVDSTDVDERAVAGGLDLRMLALQVPTTGAPPPADLLALVRFLRSADGTVYLHDTTGHGPVVVVAAVLRLLRGVPLADVLRALPREDVAALSEAQLLALHEVAAVVAGTAPPTSPYAGLKGAAW